MSDQFLPMRYLPSGLAKEIAGTRPYERGVIVRTTEDGVTSIHPAILHPDGSVEEIVQEPMPPADSSSDLDITIEKRTLQIVFDVAVESLDFGSGFLDDEEVAGLRAVAEVLGVDPMLATPSNFKCKYTGLHERLTTRPDWCWRCRQTVTVTP